ncbi:MAG: putative Xaa-Pro aminopeptidase [Clostridiaceae bacterium]|jgi:Xaa-Pro aminopeptidase|nr:putative Xaa-Pro aminopeptidase [Clostridiaceae bacterium]
MDKNFYVKNRDKLYEKLEDNSILVLFAGQAPYKSADEKYSFTPNRNFLYLTGIAEENLIFTAYKRNGIINEVMFIERQDPVMARWVGERISKDEVAEKSGIISIQYIDEFQGYIGGLLGRFNFQFAYFDLERAEWSNSLNNAQSYADELRTKYPHIMVKNIYHEICKLRVIKTQEEIDVMEKAIAITIEGVENMMKNCMPGMMEYEIEAYFDYSLRRNGVVDKAFNTICGSGKNGATLHYSSNNCKTNENDLVLCDLGAQYEYYNADITRTFPVSGKFTERQKQIYNVVLKANMAVIEKAKAGISFADLEDTVRNILTDGLIDLGLIKGKSELSKYYFHSFGHHLGSDTHDVGGKEMNLQAGMVITNEPGLYIPEESIGVRIEDDLLITETGCKVLTKNMIKSIEDIENFMCR